MESSNIGLTKKERRMLRYKDQEVLKQKEERKVLFRKIRTYSLWIIFFVGVIGIMIWVTQKPQPGEKVADLGNEHIANINSIHIPYNSFPPTSGPHLDNIAPWGISQEPIPNELQVHNLEDGGVMVQYWCGGGWDLPENSILESTSTVEVIADYQKGCPELVEQLESIVKKYSESVILAPYPGLAKKIALTSWTRIDIFDEFDEARIRRFIDAYRGIDHHVGARPRL